MYSFELPSGTELELREMTGAEEELLTNQRLIRSGEAINQVLRNCFVRLGEKTDPDLSEVMNLLSGDRLFALVRLRQVSLGDEVELELSCPNSACRMTNFVTVNLEDLKVTPYGEEREFVFKLPGSKLVLLSPAMRDGLLPNAGSLKLLWAQVETLIKEKKVLSAYTPSMGGLAEALFKMGLGNRLGVRFAPGFDAARLYGYAYGSFVLELAEDIDVGTPIGETTARYVWELNGETADLAKVQEAYEAKLEPVLPYRTAEAAGPAQEAPALKYEALNRVAPKVGTAKPRVLIPVFPGTNCEYDSARAMERAGAEPEVFVINNLTPAHVAESVAAVKELIGRSQMIFLPGGFSGGDEPEGSAKFITAFFRNPAITEAVRGLLQKRDGLMLGICNGFQALIKLGLVPFGDIVETDDTCPTLTFNTIGRHQSMLVRTRVASNLSPWLQYTKPGDVHTVAVSHGEGRFVAGAETLDRLVKNGQIATQYVDLSGKPTMDVRHNPNGSYYAVEGITSPDGRVLGKMGHSERSGDNLYKNVDGNKYQKLFEGGVDYFKL